MTVASPWDVLVVGAGPAGASAAIGALRADPGARVALLDRSDFPRDKVCGDGIAPHALALLAAAGVTGLVDDQVPVTRLRLHRGPVAVARAMDRPAYVVPRAVLDARLVAAAVAAGARLLRGRVREVRPGGDHVIVRCGDGTALTARTVVGADGAHSVVRRSLGLATGRQAVALRGYAPTAPDRAGVQVIVFGTGDRPSYAWSFDRGDGLANVGYGEFLTDRRGPSGRPTRAGLLADLERLLPGATADGRDWRGHRLPLSSWRPLQAGRGPVLLAGDAAGLVNPLTGEGIYYAVATGLLAGECAVTAAPGPAAAPYTRRVRALLGTHLRHTAAAAALCRRPVVLDAGLRASAADQQVFDDLVELGLAQGRLTSRLAAALPRHAATGLVRRPRHRRLGDPSDQPDHRPDQEGVPCAS